MACHLIIIVSQNNTELEEKNGKISTTCTPNNMQLSMTTFFHFHTHADH